MNYNDFDSAGQMSQEASLLMGLCLILGYLSAAVPLLQIISYTIGIVIGMGTLILNWNKYVTELKKAYKKIVNAFKKTK